MDDAVGVRVGLGVYAVDDEQAVVMFLEERLVGGERGVGDVPRLSDLLCLGPVVDDGLAGGVGLGVAEAGGVPAAVGVDEDAQAGDRGGGQRGGDLEECASVQVPSLST